MRSCSRAHLGVQAEGVQQGLSLPHALQVKDNRGELIADQDILIIEGQLQNVLGANRNKQPKMKGQKHQKTWAAGYSRHFVN